MQKLTRTQKFAGLRDSLANDAETNITSSDLTNYQNRLDAVQETLAPTPEVNVNKNEEVVENNSVNINDVSKQEPQENNYSNDSVSNVQEVEEPKQVEKENIINTVTKTVEEPKQVENDNTINTVTETIVENQENQNDDYIESLINKEPQESDYFSQFMSTAQDVEPKKDYSSYFENDSDDKFDIDSIFSEVFNDVKDNTDAKITEQERDNYLNQAIDDANSYINVSGEVNTDQIVNNLVDEVRHPEEPSQKNLDAALDVNEGISEESVDDSYSWNEEEPLDADVETSPEVENVSNEEFTNTVSMEVSKIMDEINNKEVVEEKVVEEVKPVETAPIIEKKIIEETKPVESKPIIEEKVEPVIKEEVKVEEKIVEPIVQKEVKIEEPAKETVVEKVKPTFVEDKTEDIVEIKNIAEMDNEPIKETVSSTIPFIVDSNDEDEIEDDEDDSPNTILNIILIVLIVALVAVLGLIIFYILKTKGIL